MGMSTGSNRQNKFKAPIFRIGKYRFFFNSREERRRHVHIESPDVSAKFWLEPEIEIAIYYGIPESEFTYLRSIIRERRNDFIEEWDRHFGI